MFCGITRLFCAKCKFLIIIVVYFFYSAIWRDFVRQLGGNSEAFVKIGGDGCPILYHIGLTLLNRFRLVL